jgi:predicted dehydrogenase
MVATMTDLRISRLSARLDKFVGGRQLDDNATIMVEYEGGAKGVYWSSQIAIGYGNALQVRIFGTKGTIEWAQETPDQFRLVTLEDASQTWYRGRDPFTDSAQKYSRLPAGHPEGVYEAFANIYRAFTNALRSKQAGNKINRQELEFPTVEAGAEGVRFVEACVESSEQGATWVAL